jgi:hypothetical protein
MENVMIKENTDLLKVNISFRDTAHFYKVVKWLNTNVGHGKEHWTIDGRVLRLLKRSGNVNRAVIIRSTAFNPDDALYLSLL